jgi:hypothetical protein
LPNPAERAPSGSPVPFEGISGGGRDLGGGAKAAGLQKLGQGIEGALGDWAAKRKAQQEAAAIAGKIPANNPVFGRPAPPSGVTSGQAGGVPTPFTPPPVGAASNTPIFGQPGGYAAGGTDAIPPIGGGGSLPTFAQGAPVTEGGVAQFLTGIKAGEGVPYSGQSKTGAIGAYGLTGDFIKQWAPGAGLPTDRASYTDNPDLQDQLATYAATQMHDKYGSWPAVANAWLTGSPTATTSAPGNMSPSAYDTKVMGAANMGGIPPLTAPSASAYAAGPPTSLGATPPLATAGATSGSQPVIPGQTDPHQPGFDPSSVPFHRTPEMDQPPLLNGGQPGIYSMPGQQGMNGQGIDPLAAALAGQGDPNNPQLSPAIVAALNDQPFGFNALFSGSAPDLGGIFG